MSMPYRVLARKYRPKSFADLIGQDVLVRTLSNAIEKERFPQAVLLTGIRGVGKTTTARIIARMLNCEAAEKPTVTPCGVCAQCTAIDEDRHMDVLEMDAASRTGVGDIREIIETVRYAPTSGRFKVYIIDEVHMLSTNAFNALLKTLEEPPPRVKFVFATTELRKIPITILSRCMRFDLKRVDAAVLSAHLQGVCDKESVAAEPEALALIAGAGEGSVRDALSLLDQAIAMGEGAVTQAAVQDMLGLADKQALYALFGALAKGEIADTLAHLRDLYAAGADPLTLVQDLLEITHFLTRLKLLPALAGDASIPEIERRLGGELAGTLSHAALAAMWQMLLKGLGEIKTAPSAIHAAEMVLIRLSLLADLPSPAELVKQLRASPPPAAAPTPFPAPSGGGSAVRAVGTSALPQAQPALAPQAYADPNPRTFPEVVALFEKRGEFRLHNHLVHDIRPVACEAGRLEIHPAAHLPPEIAGRLGALLREWTGERWMVMVSASSGGATLAEEREAEKRAQFAAAAAHPIVAEALSQFPGAEIIAIEEESL